jgi:hypothetical protein
VRHARSLLAIADAGIRAPPDSMLRLSRATIGGCPEAFGAADDHPEGMNARAIDESETRLGRLRRTEWESFALGLPLLVAAVVASQLHPSSAPALFFGGLTAMIIGVRAEWRRWELLDRLVGERDAYSIPEVRARAQREASQERRHDRAIAVRLLLDAPGTRVADRIADSAEELSALARELDDEDLDLEPAAAVACARLFADPVNSPLLNAAAHADDVRSRVRQIRSGFNPRRVPA